MSGPQLPSSKNSDKCDPVCQLFINGYGKRSRYTFTNFASLYCPDQARPCTYSVVLFDECGNPVKNTTLTVPPFGTTEFSPVEYFSGSLPEVGLIATELVDWDTPAYLHLGVLRPYFYAMYHDDGLRSIAIVHPHTTLRKTAPETIPWRSSHVVCTDEIDGLEVFQINPLTEERETSISVCDLEGKIKVTSAARMPPRGVRRIFWNVGEFGEGRHVSLSSVTLTAPNAKPLIFQHRSGNFTAAHA